MNKSVLINIQEMILEHLFFDSAQGNVQHRSRLFGPPALVIDQ